MDYNFESSMRWTNGESTQHRVELDLDLEVTNILASMQNLEARLMQAEGEIRDELFRRVAEEIVPKIITDTGEDHAQPVEHVSVKSHSEVRSRAEVGIPTRHDTSLKIRDLMSLGVDLDTDTPMTALQALNANRGGLASDITNEIMKLLRRAVLKVDDSSTETSWSLSGNRVDAHEHRVKRSSSEKN